jgi:hypothetical protein
MIAAAIVGLFVGGLGGVLGMSLFAVNAYEKGFEDGRASKNS